MLLNMLTCDQHVQPCNALCAALRTLGRGADATRAEPLHVVKRDGHAGALGGEQLAQAQLLHWHAMLLVQPSQRAPARTSVIG